MWCLRIYHFSVKHWLLVESLGINFHPIFYPVLGNFVRLGRNVRSPLRRMSTYKPMKDAYIRALSAGDKNLFSRISDFFHREPESEHGAGMHYILDVFGSSGGNDGARVLRIVCENLDIPVVDLRDPHHSTTNIRGSVQQIFQDLPARCAVILDIRDNAKLQKVRARIATKHCDLRYRRLLFCLNDPDRPPTPSSPSTHHLYVPGSLHARSLSRPGL